MTIVITSGLFLLISILIIPIICLSYLYVGIRNKDTMKRRKEVFWTGIFAFYICIMVSFTILPIRVPGEIPCDFEYNLSVLDFLKAFTNRAALISYCENILLFMPVTIFGHLGNVHMVKSLKGSVLISFVMSVGIELIQGLEAILCIAEDMTPIMDVNDVICNTIGGAIGYMLVRFCTDQHKNEVFDSFHSL